LMVSRSPSVISAVVGSGVGVGFGFKIGGGGGAPSCGAMRRPGPIWGTGVGVCVAVAVAVCRGRESTGCWLFDCWAPAIKVESAAVIQPQSANTPRRVPDKWKVRNLILTKPSMSKSLMSNDFRNRESARERQSDCRSRLKAHFNDAQKRASRCRKNGLEFKLSAC
jgi:hypothetical protein